MKKLLVGVAIVGVLGLLVVPAMADTPGQPGPITLDVNITVESYCEIEMDVTQIDLTLDAGNSAAGLVDFTVRSNDAVTIVLTTNDPIFNMHKEGTSEMVQYPCALLQGGTLPDDGLGYSPQLKAVQKFTDGTEAGLVIPTGYGYYTEGGGGEHGGEIWAVVFWNTSNQDIQVQYTSGGTFRGQVGFSANIANTRTGDFAKPGTYTGSMTITVTTSL